MSTASPAYPSPSITETPVEPEASTSPDRAVARKPDRSRRPAPPTPAYVTCKLRDMRLTAEGTLFVPGVATRCMLTDHARRQLACLVGRDLDTLAGTTSPGERAQLAYLANQRLHGVPHHVRVQVQAERTASGVVVTDVALVASGAAVTTSAQTSAGWRGLRQGRIEG